MKQLFIFGLAFFLSIVVANAQVTIDPTFPKDTDSITVSYDATTGNQALKDLGPPIVYMHAGVITDKSTSSTDWKYVQGNWGTADNKVLMTYMGNNTYQKKYHIKNFYGVPGGENIKRLAFVFRNVDGSKVGRTTDGSDIFVEVGQIGFAVQFVKPTYNEALENLGTYIDIQAIASDSANLQLYLNATLLVADTFNTQIEHLLQIQSAGNHTIKVLATKGTSTASDSFSIVVNPNRPLRNPAVNKPDGVESLSTGTVRFTLYAPQKNFVYVLGDFNNWRLDTNYLMHKTTDGNRFWMDVANLNSGQEYAYQYFIDGALKVADPFSTKVLDPWNDQYISNATYPNLKPYPTDKTTDIVSVFTVDPTPYAWKTTNFTPPANTDMVVYEMLIRDFVAAHSFKTVMDSLDYLQNLGVNAIELMPVSEFEGNESWGYNVSFHMALDKYYGTADAFKALVDACHARGIAVILDVVYNHAFSQSPLCKMYWDAANSRPTASSPYANVTAKHPFNVGYDLNHESSATKYWFDRINRYWLEEFRVDGFRFDLSKGYTQKNTGSDVNAMGQYDASRIAILKRMSDTIRSYKPNALLILEHFADNSEEKELGSYGFMLWNNINHEFGEAALGFTSNLNSMSYKARGHNKADWVSYMESHDEERLMFKNLNYGNSDGSYNIKQLPTALKRIEMNAMFFMSVPGPKMIWQFGELGYDISINQNGRLGNKPILWSYLTDSDRRQLYQNWSELIQLKTSYDVFKTDNFSIGLTGMSKYVQLNHKDMDVYAVGNYDVVLSDITMGFQHTGWWYEYFTGDSLEVTQTNVKHAFDPGEYRLYTSKRIDRPEPIFVNVLDAKKPEAFVIYPNPSSTSFQLVYRGGNAFEGSVKVVNSSGQVVYQSTARLMPGDRLWFNQEFVAGIYSVVLIDQDGQSTLIKHMVL